MPLRLKQAYWWVTDPSWRLEHREVRKRVAAYQRGQRLAERTLRRRHGDMILTGPFAGMKFPPVRQTFNAHVLIGSHELEIHEWIESICLKNYPLIVDIGADNGYYLCGLALRSPRSLVVGFEIVEKKHQLITKIARQNHVSDRIEVRGACDEEDLRITLRDAENAVIICDIDGGEHDLLRLEAVPELARCDMLIETHDSIVPGVTATLRDRFAESHSIEEVEARPRTARDLPHIDGFDVSLALRAMDEARGNGQSWLWLRSMQSHKCVMA